jgi:fatty-acyl-CoA synthase
MGGTHVCLRAVEPKQIFQLIVDENVTHMCGAPTVLTMLITAPEEQRRKFARPVHIQTGGSPPPAKVIQAMEELGFQVLHIYGMTELQGPSTFCAAQEGWHDRYTEMARQGVRYPVVEGHIVGDPRSCKPVPKDGKTIGEVLVRGNTVMLGYLKDAKASGDAFAGGWMHTGDLAVMDDDGYVSIVGRLKDVIIRGGENVYPREVEEFLHTIPGVAEAQVVGVPSAKYGEEVVAWVRPAGGADLTAAGLRAACAGRIASFKIPRHWKFVDAFPMTVTGKVQKFRIREIAAAELAGG